MQTNSSISEVTANKRAMTSGCSIFTTFGSAPTAGSVTIGEQNGHMLTASSTTNAIATIQSQLSHHPMVTIPKEATKSFSQRENAKSAFLLHDETVWKRTMHAWYEVGLPGIFEEIVNSQEEVPAWTASIAKSILMVVRGVNSLHGSLFPHLSMTNEEMISQFSSIVDWLNSPVKAFSWHPHTNKCAYALQDDSIKVQNGRNDLVPTLKHKLQKNVADLAWSPYSSSILAVACQSCVLIWHVEPTSLATRPSTSSVQVLKQSNHGPVTSLAWDPNGNILLTSSPVDTAIMAWDVSMETCVPLRRNGGGGVSFIRWSPDGSKVFTATPSHVLRVWETNKWSCEKWTKCTGRCKAACWNPDGSILLFATENEPIIYSLKFSTQRNDREIVIGGSQMAVAAVNISAVDIQTEDGRTISVGGLVHSMTWDATGERLAVILHNEQKETQPLVVLFRTKSVPMLEITPCGYVQGPAGCTPHCIAFQPKFDQGALLTVVWSNGSVMLVPLYFVPNDMVNFNPMLQQPDIPMLNGHIVSPIRPV